MADDPLFGNFSEAERVARETAALSQESLRNMQEAERVGNRLKGAGAGPAGALGRGAAGYGGTRAGGTVIRDEARALEQLATDAERARAALGELEATQARLGALGRSLGPALRQQGAAIGRAAGLGAGYGAGGAGAPPPPPPRPPAPPAGAGGGADDGGRRARAVGETSRLAKAQDAEALATKRSAIELQRQISVLGGASQAYRKHGALTSEFIQAAARGETNYREWGYQIGATAAKFAGWTAVSIPVFAALDGVRKIGQGAIASSSGVQGLQRVMNNVDGSRLQGQFRDLARQFNVPIETASDAVYRMGQVFHNQTDAVEAAKAALYSFRTGEVDVATSTRFLNAIVRGFGFSGRDLTHVYDQINQAQNQFGISIGDVEAGMARAAGAFKNAGGGASYLLALIGTMQQVTGRTGQNVGTAIQRSIGFIQRPANQASLRQMGIDTSQGIESIYSQAFEKARGLQGAELQRLATAISSPQYASYFVPLLQNYQRFQKFLQNTSPQRSAQSAQNELNRVLGQASERLKRFGTELEILGSNLASSGLLAPIAAAVDKALQLASIGNNIASTFNQLPAPVSVFGINLRQAAVAAIALMGALRVAQRFQFGNRITEPLGRYSGVLGGGTQRQVQRQVGRGINDEVQFFRDERERRARSAAIATAEADIAQQRYAAETRVNAASEKALVAEERALTTRQRALVLAEEEEAINLRLAEAEARATAFRQQVVKGRVSATEFASARELYYVPSSARPTSTRPVQPTLRETAIQRAAQGTAAEDAPTRAQAVLRYMDAVEAENNRIVTTSERLRAVPTRLRATTTRIGAGLRGFAGSLRGAASSLAGLVGPFELVLAGAIIIPAVYGAEKRSLDAHQKLLGELQRSPVSQADLTRLRQQAAKAAGHEGYGGFFARVGHALSDTFLHGRIFHGQATETDTQRAGAQRQQQLIDEQERANRQLIPNRLDVHQARTDLELARELQADAVTAKQRADARKRVKQAEETYRRAQAGQGAQYGPRADLLPEQVSQSVGRDVTLVREGILSVHEARRRMNLRIQEINAAQKLSPEQRERARVQIQSDFLSAIADRTKRNIDYLRALAHMTTEAVKTDADAFEAVIGAGFATGQQRTRYSEARLEQVLRAAPVAGPKGKDSIAAQRSKLELVAQYTQAWENTLQTDAKNQFDRATLFSRSTSDRNRAWDNYTNYVQRYGIQPIQAGIKNLRGERGGIRNQIANTEREIARLQGRAAPATGLEAAGLGGLAPATDREAAERVKQLRARLISLRGRLGLHDQKIKNAERQLKIFEAYEKQFRAERERERFQEQQQLQEAQTEVYSYNYRAGVERITYQLRRQHSRVLAAIRQYGKGSAEVLQEMAKERQLQEQLVQQQAQNIEAQGAYRESLQSTESGRAQEHVRTLQQQLAFESGHRKQYSPADIWNLRAQINDAQRSAADAVRQDAESMINARYGILETQTNDPVQQARYEVQKATELLGYARTPVEQAQAQLALAQARQTLANAIRDQAKQLIAAGYALREAQTEDPVKQARLELEAARSALKFAQTPAERVQAQADIARATHAYRNAQVQSKVDRIDFLQQMDRIDADTAISMYRTILNTQHLSHAWRNRIKLAIHQLQTQGQEGFDLDVGSIKLPTVYDVRRAFDPIRKQVRQAHEEAHRALRTRDFETGYQGGAAGGYADHSHHDVRAQVNIYVNNQGNIAQVYQALDDVLGTHVKAHARSRHHRGVR